MTRIRSISFVLALLIIAASCGDDSSDSVAVGADGPATDTKPAQVDPGDPFGTTEWILARATVDGTPLTLLEQYPVTLLRNGSDVGGSAACNSYFGTIVKGEALFEGFGVTEMGCEPNPMTLESSYLDALSRVHTAEGSEGTLRLTGDGVELLFQEVVPPPDASLQGTDWILDTLIDGDTASSTVSGATASLVFGATTISGSDGCNTFQGDYELDGESLRLGLLSSTTRGCEDGVMRQAQQIGAILAAGPTVEVDGNRLTFGAANGLGLVYHSAE